MHSKTTMVKRFWVSLSWIFVLGLIKVRAWTILQIRTLFISFYKYFLKSIINFFKDFFTIPLLIRSIDHTNNLDTGGVRWVWLCIVPTSGTWHLECPPGASHPWWCGLAQDCGPVLLWSQVRCFSNDTIFFKELFILWFFPSVQQ